MTRKEFRMVAMLKLLPAKTLDIPIALRCMNEAEREGLAKWDTARGVTKWITTEKGLAMIARATTGKKG